LLELVAKGFSNREIGFTMGIALVLRVVYMAPSTTNGVASRKPFVGAWRSQAISRSLTFSLVMWVSALCRWPCRFPEYVSQFWGSSPARKIRSNVTLGGVPA
jgi:hypothetical protein